MNIKKVISVLKKHNAWRRGDDESVLLQNPKIIGEAIDAAVEYMRNNERKNKVTKKAR